MLCLVFINHKKNEIHDFFLSVFLVSFVYFVHFVVQENQAVTITILFYLHADALFHLLLTTKKLKYTKYSLILKLFVLLFFVYFVYFVVHIKKLSRLDTELMFVYSIVQMSHN